MNNLKTNINFTEIDNVIADEEKYKSVINFLTENNRIKVNPFGFEYNEITELVIELELKDISKMDNISPIGKFKDEQNGYIIQEPSEEFLYLYKIINYGFSLDWAESSLYHYLSIIKFTKTVYIEKLKMLTYLLAKINKNEFNINNIFINMSEKIDDTQLDTEIPVEVICRENNYLQIKNEEEFILALTFEKNNNSGKYMALYKLLENKLTQNKLTIEKIKLDTILENCINNLYDKCKSIVDLNKYNGISMFKCIRNHLAHGNKLETIIKLKPIMNELIVTLMKIVNDI